LPDGTRVSIIIHSSIDILVLEAGHNESTVLGLIAISNDFRGIDVFVQVAVQIILDDHVGRKVELAVKRASAVA